MSTSRAADPDAEARAAGWDWLATLPRGVTAHASRGADPLANVRALLAALGDPHTRVRALHLAGSKGKGSTALLCEALLGALGQRTLTYTSPHLERWTERFRLDGAEAPADDALAGEFELPVDLLWHLPAADRDFDGQPRKARFFGAYAGASGGAAWQPALAIKPSDGYAEPAASPLAATPEWGPPATPSRIDGAGS